jgi:hypothetical protein
MLGATQNQLFNVDTSGALTGLKPYTPYSTNMNDYVAGFSPLQSQAQTQASGLTMPGQFAPGTSMATASGLGALGTATTAAGAGNDYMKMAQDPAAMKNFMNPYLKDTLDPALAELRRQYGISGTQEQSAATGAGAFGGSREALMAAENQRNLGTAQSQMIGQGYDKAFQQAQQAQQYGSNLGLQGQQAALQGYGQAGQAGATLGQLGGQQLSAQQGIIGTQAQQGAQQQAQQQQMINQAIQNYATAQQYPLMELGTMSNMLRGLPMQAATTQQYQAQPTALTSAIGTAGAIGSLGKAAGAAKGGIMSYNIGGAVEYDLSRMPTDKLNDLKQTAPSKIEKDKINKILAERKLDETPEYAPGGIVAFQEGGAWDKFKRGISGLAGTQEAKDAEAAEEPDKVTPFLGKAARFLAGNEDAATTSPTATTAVQPGINAAAPAIKLGRDINTYLPPDLNVDVPSAGEAPKEVAAKAPSDIDAIMARLTRSPSPAAAATPTVPYNPDETLGGITPSNILTKSEAIQNKLAEDLRDIYKDPIQAPYAKKQFDYFQSKIDNAPNKEQQTFWLHSATMFAKMATLPGGVVKAAMGSLAEQIPLYVKDKEAQEKALDDLNKAQYDLSQSEIARRVGDAKTAAELKDKALTQQREIYTTLARNKMESEKMGVEKQKLGIEQEHYRSAADIGRLQVAATLAGYNKPGETEKLIDHMLHDKDFAAVANEYRNGSKEIQDAAKMRTDYDKYIAGGGTGSIDEYAATHKVGAGGNAFPGFTDKTNYKG